jgi:4-diphosphocytidyl-2-C-methyl-D-erythritol kinase
MICFPNCKINLGLSIVEKRDDGFHNIETVFYPLTFCDALEIQKTEGATSLYNYGVQIPGSSHENLCLKAYHLLKRDHKIGSVEIHLMKNIPAGAGLGGGSSDATHTLLLLNDLFSLSLNNEQIKEYAKQLGSDCAFFIENKPAFASGKGDQFENIQIDLKGFFLVLIIPIISVSTAEAYAGVKPFKKEKSIKEIIQLPLSKWKDNLVNDFEETVFEKYPEIQKIKKTLYTEGAVYASMSGSGSAVYGIFDKEKDLRKMFPDCVVQNEML